ncbi:putative DNA repair protein [Aspergillus avenaceus]|uniref:Protein artemis n=1 Tax=Aspergillus avenaceus TaxID=36643 RepID=A0A5N6TTG8_ASPAV|nr:putative DNA repair protein [Aspergillus avenaceus]
MSTASLISPTIFFSLILLLSFLTGVCTNPLMSTFDGIIQEFPYIQIDYFRKTPDRPAPLAGFLSHVHSDHLQGLESFRAPFIYCSAATRELLLRIEKYPHRMNFNKGILESRRLHYKHLSKLLRPIPLNTPTEIELTPRLSIRVTLLDANHCTGAVMFLIEGDGKSVLYTGDIRAESWWVNSLIRHPVLIPYTLGSKRLDNIYIDSTFARHSSTCRTFPSKAEGLAELIEKVACYPDNTTFYFRAWTFGYEEVWMALSAALNTKVHVDRYQISLYKSLASSRNSIDEAHALCGFELGNRFVSGCLSEDEESRIHSCEPGVSCSAIPSKNPVYIIPIVSRTKDGPQVPEVGAGGGGGDLYQTHELEIPNEATLEQLEKLCLERIHDPKVLSHIRHALVKAYRSKNKALCLDSHGLKHDQDMPLDTLVSILSRGNHNEDWSKTTPKPATEKGQSANKLPQVIHFAYSRHSSYAELCELVSAFQPKEVFPCTVDLMTWDEDMSMQNLFGHLCTGTDFTHDQYMRDVLASDDDLRSRKRARYEEPSQQSSQHSTNLPDSAPQPICTNTETTPEPKGHTASPENHPSRPIIHSSTQSSSIIRIPSSLDTISETKHPSTEPRGVQDHPQDTEKARQDEVREAWHFLNHTRTEQDTFHLGSLPSSWPTDEGSRSQECTAPEPTDFTRPLNGAMGVDVDVERESSQKSYTISISSSAFASQEYEMEEYDDMDPDGVPVDVRAWGQLGLRSTRDEKYTIEVRERERSSRTRRAAYIAAKADSYDAWSSIGLVSAGNNHTEEEIEL